MADPVFRLVFRELVGQLTRSVRGLWRRLLPTPALESFGPRVVFVEPAEIVPVVEDDDGHVWRVIGTVWPEPEPALGPPRSEGR